MSDEPKKPRGKWPNWSVVVFFGCVVFAAYEGAYYATASPIRAIDEDGRVQRVYYFAHRIGSSPAPEWVDRYFFRPANWIDDLINLIRHGPVSSRAKP
jgi:hypothetical protein